jgi:Carboxypeptidase regulatory-like domain
MDPIPREEKFLRRQEMRFTTSIRLLALLAVMALIVPTVVVGQGITSGAVTGVVTDASNAVVPNATVTLKSEESGAVLTQTTGATGTFNFTLLKPGSYRVSLSQQGFRAVAEKVDVVLGQTSTANIKLEVGSTSETLEVTSEAPLLQTEDANISTTFNTEQILALPTPGGDITTYAQTAPGVLMNTGGSYGNFSAFGLPATSNLFTLNGNDENDPFLNLNNSGSSNLLLGQNEVQEVAVVSNGYTAQYGRQAGVQVDYTTKSGSNAIHGDAAFWYNSSMFNANDWFQKNSEVANGLPNQQPFAVNHMWAGSVGGPIVKDKLFFYVDQEGLYYALPSEQQVFLPTSAFITQVQNNINGQYGPGSPQSAFYSNLLGLYAGSPAFSAATPLPSSNNNAGCGDVSTLAAFASFNNGTAGTPCSAEAQFAGVNHNKEWLLTERIDYNISNSNKLFGRFKVDHGSQPTSTDLIDRPIFSTQSIQPEYEGQINFTHVFTPNIVNNAILSGLWYTAYFAPNSGQAAVLQATGGYSTIDTASSFTAIGGGLGAGQTPDFVFPQGRNSSMGQLTDDFSITKGNHTFKMGVNVRRDILVDYDAQSNTGGFAIFGDITDFVNGTISGGDGGVLEENYTTNGDVRIGFYSLGLYFQDEFRVTPNLKLTLALRGDRNSNPICSQDCYSRFNTSFTSMTHDINTPYNAVIASGQHSAFPSVEKVALQPRIGFTWSPFGHTSTVLRGGIGVFSDLYQGVLMDEMIGNTPGTNGFIVAPSAPASIVPSVPNSIKQQGAGSNSSLLSGFSSGQTVTGILASNPFFTPPNYTSIANQINNPKYLEWNFEIQQAFGSKMTLNVDYVGTHGYDALIQNGNLNASAVAGTTFGQLPQTTANGLSGTDPRFGAVRELQSVGINNYDGLVTTLTRRFTHGFQGSINYTFAHALDDLTTTNPGTPFNATYSMVYQINPYCLRCGNYSNGDADARHNITANYVWDLPFKTQSKLLNEAVGGWTIAGTFYAHSGLPWTPEAVPDANDLFPNPIFGAPFAPADFTGGATTCQVGGPGGGLGNSCVNQSAFPSFAGANQLDFGNIRRNSFRGLGYFDTDMNVNKSFAVTERVKFELGGSFFNILNHPNFALPQPFTQDITGTTFGTMTSLAVQPTTPYGAFQGAGVEGRLIQVHGKITF